YALSGKRAARPAPDSTTTSSPAPVNRPTSSGTSATRRSCSRISFTTTTFIEARRYRAAPTARSLVRLVSPRKGRSHPWVEAPRRVKEDNGRERHPGEERT